MGINLKTLLVILKNTRNNISWDSNLSLDIKLQSGNTIKTSTIYNTSIGSFCTINKASIFSSNLGNNINLLPKAILFSASVANNVFIGAKTAISNSKIGRYSYLAGNNRIFHAQIGCFCSIAENACVGHAEHPYNLLSTSPLFYKADNPFGESKFLIAEEKEFKQTTIGHDVWIGYNAYIKSGVTIGNGSIIGAGAVVTKDVAPYSIVGGVPSKMIKMRFDEFTINSLQNSKWWDLDDQALKEFSVAF